MSIIYFDELASTNAYAKENIDSLTDGTVICAKRQNAGHGQFGREWVDLGEGNLFASIVLKPSDMFKDEYSGLTLYAAQTLCKVLENYGLKPEIKLPNDILINKKKVAGVLCETVSRGGKIKGLVLGVGVNLNANPADLLKIPGQPATALNIELNKTVNCNEFLNEFISRFSPCL